ncbi:DUF4830 domain-containing protein [Acutalibacter sp. JLR.KK004]|jgi:hypothetical protein|uniref:DUF4830 domain-containing protein n=1 Tax=Acutalibacter sp. JLR.KK004 TaxID=3112622 RepID=UPI0021747CF2|nr:DUF4830 domain-containing protein [Acutalibacter sp.]
MVVSLKANKKRVIAFLVLAAVVVGACIFLRMEKEQEPQQPQEIVGETNEERVAFLQSFGWEVEAQAAETREVMIPAEFNDVYTAYNAMQQAQGFDLLPYAGQVCTQYKYRITNYPEKTEVFATLLVYGRIVIGGDVACAEVDGFMHGFAPDSARYGETAVNNTGSRQNEASASSAPAAVESAPAESAPAADQGAASAVEPVQESGVESTGGELLPEEAYPTD